MWRGVPENLSHMYNRGGEKAWWSFSSCTSACSVLELPQYLGKKGTRALFSIETSSGKRIQEHSYFQQEEEILLPPDTYFEVIDKVNPAAGLYIIHLRETEPPYQLLVPPFDLTDSRRTHCRRQNQVRQKLMISKFVRRSQKPLQSTLIKTTTFLYEKLVVLNWKVSY